MFETLGCQDVQKYVVQKYTVFFWYVVALLEQIHSSKKWLNHAPSSAMQKTEASARTAA
jgi:hypothetical protein